MPFPDPLDFDFHPLGDYETEERGGGGREKKKMSRNTVSDEFPFVGQETSTPASKFSSRGFLAWGEKYEKHNSRTRDGGTGAGGRGEGEKIGSGRMGRRGAAVAELRARARACVRVGRVSERCSSGRME